MNWEQKVMSGFVEVLKEHLPQRKTRRTREATALLCVTVAATALAKSRVKEMDVDLSLRVQQAGMAAMLLEVDRSANADERLEGEQR